MRGKIKTARKKASKLHGATAQYVSLVDAGANETPFTMIKSKDGAKAMTIKKRKTTGAGKTAQKKSHKPLTNAKKEGDVTETRTETLIAKMVFDVDVFETEDDVREYIEKAEWEADDIEVVQNADGNWEARSDGLSDDDFDKIGKVDTDEDGVEAFVGQRTVEVTVKATDDDDEDDDETDIEAKSDDDEEDDDEDDELAVASKEDEDEDEKASMEDKGKGKKKPYSKRSEFVNRRKEAKAKETVSKFDAWDARFSKGNTLSKALADGMSWDATPPGYYEVQVAFNAAVTNIISGEGMPEGSKQEALNKAAMDYAEIIGGLDTFFDQYVEMDEETLEKAVSDDKERAALIKWAEGYADFVAGEAAPEAVAKAAVTNVAIDYNKVTETVQDIIAKALDPLSQRLDGVSETVEAISTRAPTKKAAAPEDGGPAGPRTVKQKAVKPNEDDEAKRFAKSFFG